jgi:hypothetical protein
MWQFFTVLFTPIFKVLDWIKQFILSWWGWVLGIFAFILIPINYVLDLFIAWFNFLNTRILQLTDYIEGIWDGLTSTYSSVASTLAIGNALFPLGTLFTILTLLFILWVIGLVYRLIKSYVPTLS